MPVKTTKPGRRAGLHGEFVMEFAPGGAVDRARNTVRGVKLCGARSRNGRKYPAHVLERAAALFEGKPVHIGHHYDERTGTPVEVPPTAKFGRVVNVRAAAGGLVGDLSYNPQHSFAAPFLWACENDPAAYCFSILARVKWKPGTDADGDLVAESIAEVASVDIVTEGGTTRGVFESLNRTNTNGATMFPIDPKQLASEFETPGQLSGFLIDLLRAMPFKGAERETVYNALGAIAGAPPAPSAPPASAVGSLADAMQDADLAALAESYQRDPILKRLAAAWHGGGGSRLN